MTRSPIALGFSPPLFKTAGTLVDNKNGKLEIPLKSLLYVNRLKIRRSANSR